MFNVVKEKKEWDAVVEQCDYSDCYHTFDYHRLAKGYKEEPILICYHTDNSLIAVPLLIRPIDNTLYNDATSVYGYPGPLTKNIKNTFDFDQFHHQFTQFLKDLNIISAFSRLNPFIPEQGKCLNSLGTTTVVGNIVYLDLTKTEDEQLGAYHKRLRTYINKSRATYTIKKSKKLEDIESFMELYYENMRRVSAKKEYFFTKEYFLELLHSNQFDTELMLAVCNATGKVAGGAIFILKDKIIQYHLSGASEDFLKLNPVKLLIDEMRSIGSKNGYSYLNLGGGFGSKEDSLFYFKSGFSNETAPFKVWKYIINQDVYDL